MACDGAASAACLSPRASARNRHAGIGERDPLHCVYRLPMATITEGVSTLLHGAGLFLRVVARRNLCLAQPRSRDGGGTSVAATGLSGLCDSWVAPAKCHPAIE